MKHKNFKLSTFLILGIIGLLHAQQGNVAAGGDATGVGGSVSYSVGQVNYTQVNGSGNSVLQGVQQPYEISVINGINESGIDLNLNVYPNPTASILKLSTSHSEKNLSCKLMDVSGKIISQQLITEELTQFAMDKLPNGIYTLSVYKRNADVVKTFKIIKN